MPRPRLELDEVPHGTLAGYDWHKRWGVLEVCEACAKAKRDYSRDYARDKRKRQQNEAPRKAAWQKACARLAERYPAEFREILLEEMRGLIELPPEDEDEG